MSGIQMIPGARPLAMWHRRTCKGTRTNLSQIRRAKRARMYGRSPPRTRALIKRYARAHCPKQNASPRSQDGQPSEGGEAAPRIDVSSVSFGALARAQASLLPAGPKSKKSSQPDDAAPDRPPRHVRSTGEPKPRLKRTSKHAPQEQSSKRPVSRRREVVPDTRRKARDPRFDSLGSGRLDEAKFRKTYAFLDEYRDSEMAELRAQIKKAKAPLRKEELKRQLMSMESRKKAEQQKLAKAQLLQEHRQKEKELVAQGKKPFYLKKSEQKKSLLMDRFSGMNEKQVNKAIEKKRKKVAAKERRELDHLQRATKRP